MPRAQIVCQFGVQEIAELCGVSKPAIFHHMRSGILDINDLMSVTKFLAAKARDEERMQIGYAFGRLGEYGPPIAPSKRKESQDKVAKKGKRTGTKKRIARISG